MDVNAIFVQVNVMSSPRPYLIPWQYFLKIVNMDYYCIFAF